MVIAGDSAGGGLTVATLVALRDAGDLLPAAGVCFSPWVDMECLGESMATNAGRDPLMQGGREGLREEGRDYLGGADPRTPLAAPLYADLAGLPPLLIQVGTAELLLDDSTGLAERARAAGVDVTLELWDDMIARLASLRCAVAGGSTGNRPRRRVHPQARGVENGLVLYPLVVLLDDVVYTPPRRSLGRRPEFGRRRASTPQRARSSRTCGKGPSRATLSAADVAGLFR